MLWSAYVIVVLLVILYCLFSAVYYLVHPRKEAHQLARMLTWRVVVSCLLFISLFVAYAMGWAHPHGLGVMVR